MEYLNKNIKMKKILFLIAFVFALSTNAQTIVTGGNTVINNVGGADNQIITDFSRSGNILSLTIEDGNTVTLDLTAILPVNTDDQTITNLSLNGSNVLSITLENGNTATVDLSSLAGGGGSSITSKDEGVTLTTGTTEYDFTGSGVTATNTSGAVTVNIPGGSVSGNNPNIAIVSSLAEITSAGAGATVLIIDPITLTANYTPPVGARQHWIISTTGYIDFDTYSILGDVTITLPPKGFLALDMFDSPQGYDHDDVDIRITNYHVYASNIGAIDDNNPLTDNDTAGRNLLFLANNNSAKAVWDYQTTGKYWASVSPRDEFTGGSSPFYPFDNYTTSWVIGNGKDNVIVEHESDVEIISITNDLETNRRYVFQDTRYSELRGGTLRGDRYRHRYNRTITVGTGAVSAGNIVIHWDEVDPYISILPLQAYDITVALTTGGANQNATEIASYINTNLAADGYVASASTNVVTFYKEGQDFEFDATPIDFGTTGAVMTTGQSSYEWGHAVFFSSLVEYCKVEQMHITEFHGDAFASFYQGNGTTPITEADFVNGKIDVDGTTDTDANYRRTNQQFNLPGPHQWFWFRPNTGQTLELKTNRYWLAYYDSAGNFIGKSRALIPYELYSPRVMGDDRNPPAKYEVVIEYYGSDFDNGFNWVLDSPSIQRGIEINQVEMSHLRRQVISNPPLIDFKLTNSWMHDVGGQEPQFVIDLEDYQKKQRNWEISGNRIELSGNGGIIVKGATQGKIINNHFTTAGWRNKEQFEYQPYVATEYGRDIVVANNTFQGFGYNSIDLTVNYHDNSHLYCDLIIGPGGSKSHDNIFINGTTHDNRILGSIPGSGFGSSSLGGPIKSESYDNTYYTTSTWDRNDIAYRYIDETGSIIRKNERYIFNARGVEHATLTDAAYNDLYLDQAGLLLQNRDNVDNGIHDAPVYEEKVEGWLTTAAGRVPTYWEKVTNDYYGGRIEAPLAFTGGFEKSFKVYDTEAWRLIFDLDDYATDGVGTFETIIVKDAVITPPDQLTSTTGWLVNTGAGGGSGYAIQTGTDVNANFIFIDCILDYGTNPSGNAIYFGHRGTTQFRNCTIISDNALTIDFTGSAAGANTGTITMDFIDLNGNVTVTGRGGDSITEN